MERKEVYGDVFQFKGMETFNVQKFCWDIFYKTLNYMQHTTEYQLFK